MSKINNSFGLLRTNPKLTSNYKLSVRNDGKVSISAIPANPTLSAIHYVDLPLNSRNTFANAINRLYDSGSLKNSITFEVKTQASDEVLQKDFNYQFEDLYLTGLTRTKSKIFAEEFSYFAPIYLRKDVPKFFVIFRVAGATNNDFATPVVRLTPGLTYRMVGTGSILHAGVKYTNLQQFKAVNFEFAVTGDAKVYLDDNSYIYNYIQNPDNFKKFLSDCEIAKVYDLQTGVIGGLLQGIIQDKNYTAYPVEVDFDNAQVSYRGVHIQTGVITQIVEDIRELIDSEIPITQLDEYITQGFERNGLVSLNCLNLEFLFNDEEAPDYKFYRYFGLYVDDLPIGTFYPDKTIFAAGSLKSLYPSLECLPINYNQTFTDPNGIRIKPNQKTIEGVLFEPNLLNKESIFYLQGVEGTLFKIDNQKSQAYNDYTYVLKNNSINIRAIHGFSDFTQIEATVLQTAGRSVNVLTVNGIFEYGDYIDFWEGKRLVCRLIPDDLPDWNANAYQDYIDGTYEPGRGLGPYFYLSGTNQQIAKAIAEAFNNWMPKIYNIVAYPIDDRVFFVSELTGNSNNQIRLKSSRPIYNEYFAGGTSTAKSRVRISSDITKRITENSYVRTKNGYCKITAIAPYVDEPDFGPDGILDDFDRYQTTAVLTIDSDSETIDVKHGQVVICELSPMEFGVLSFYDFKDFDFDFIKSDYNKFPGAEYKKYFNVERLETGHEYTVFSRVDSTVSAVITHDGVQYSAGETFVAGSKEFTVDQGIAVIIDLEYLHDDELKQFVGFNTLNGQQGTSQSVSTLINIDLLQNKSFAFQNTVKNEYEFLREDVDTDLVLKSRTLPTIAKWVSYSGTDIRGNKYRLNLSRAFGELGFSPSFFDHNPNPKFFTHEWPYLVGAPKNISLKDLLESNNYFTLPFDRNRLRSLTQDYFTKYFTVDYAVYEDGVNFEAYQIKRDVRYTEITRLLNGKLTTFFRGAQIDFIARQAGTTIDRLVDYKFSVILQTKRSTFLDQEPQVDFEIIDNRKFKNITFLITFVTDDYKIAPGEDQSGELYPDYISLYVMQSLKKYVGGGYLYGLEYNFYNFFIFGLFNSQAGIPIGNKITSFRGFQLPSVINYDNYGGAPNVIRFDDFYDISTFIRPTAVWDNINQVPVIAGSLGRLIAMDETKFTAITSEPIYYSAQQLIFDKPNTISAVSPTTDLILQPSGIAIINNPGQISAANYDPLDVHRNVYNMKSLVWFYENGGFGAYTQAINLLSFASIAEDINTVEKYVRYTTIGEDGFETSGADFKLNMARPSMITRNESIVLKAQKLVLPGLPQTAAEVFVKSTVPTAYTLNRFGGQFEPKTRDILKFKDDYIEMKWAIATDTWANASYNWLRSQLAQIKVTWGLATKKWQDTPETWASLTVNKETINQGTIPFSDILIGQNTRFDVSDDFAIVENIGFHRVNQSQSTVFKTPVLKYPQVDEIAISSRKVNILNSNWEAGYFTETIDKFTNIDTYGTRNLKETKAALGSKALAVPDLIQYANFSYAAGVVDQKLSQIAQSTDIIYDNTSKPKTLRFYIDLNPKFRATVYENSKDEFYRYLTNFSISTATIDDAIYQYIDQNIIPVFTIGEIRIYTKAIKDQAATVELFVSGDNEITLLQNGYVRNRNAGYKPVSDLQGIFNIAIPDNSRLSVAMVVILKKI